MRKIHALSSWIIFLVAMAWVSAVYGQTTARERGIQDVTSGPTSALAKPVGPYYALVIGNNNYSTLPKLQTAVDDARAIAKVLQERFEFKTNVLYNASRAKILNALDDYRNLPEKSNLLIYYAGHGHKDAATHRAYWLPVDAERDHTTNWINATEILDSIRAIPSRHILVISDSCWSGDLVMRDAGVLIRPREYNALLGKVLQLKSRHVMSSGGDEPVADSGSNGHSVFAYALLQSLDDMDQDEFTGEALLSQRIKPRVAGRSAQMPQYALLRDSDSDLGDFVFFRARNAEIRVPAKADADQMIVEAKKFYRAEQYDRAMPLFRSAAEAGRGEAAVFLGYMYEAGLGLTKDDAQAVGWYRKAAETNYANGMVILGHRYEYGWGGLPLDNAEAVRWYRKASDAGDAHGMTDLGRMYEIGRGLTKSDSQAVSWYRKAAEAGDETGMAYLGNMYENGRGGLPKSDTQAVNWYYKAAVAGNTYGMVAIGHMYENGGGGLTKDEATAVSWYRKAAEAGDAMGMSNLGVMYANGRGGLPKDDTQAVNWYRKAAMAGNSTGMFNLGAMYEGGRGGLGKDDAQAAYWYRKAAEAGNPMGMSNLGVMYANGRGGLAKDDAEAVNWFSKASATGNSFGMTHLADMYANGRGGLTKNDVQAVGLFRKAASAGNSDAMAYLGFMYEKGRGGLPKDIGQAVSWYRKARDLGNNWAQQALQRLGR